LRALLVRGALRLLHTSPINAPIELWAVVVRPALWVNAALIHAKLSTVTIRCTGAACAVGLTDLLDTGPGTARTRISSAICCGGTVRGRRGAASTTTEHQRKAHNQPKRFHMILLQRYFRN